ncbi:MAG: LLM class flavin-dependent oxidoreductase [Pseudomonadota bacterium]
MRLGLTPWNFDDLSARGLTAQAAFAESLGYESFWLPENHFNAQALPDPLMLLAGIAAGTQTMRLATTSYLLPLRNPLLAAEQVAVLDQLSNGRVLLGIGRGYSKETLHAFDIEPGEKRELFEWCLNLILKAWTQEEVSLHDDGSSPVVVMPKPAQQPHPPLWIAAFGPKALKQAGRLGMPYLASPIETFEQLKTNYERYDEAIAEHGHEPMTTRPIMRTMFVSDKSSLINDIRDRLANMELPRGLKTSPQVDDWAMLGDRYFVADKMAEHREALDATHIVVTRMRIAGVPESETRESISTIAELAETDA